MRLRRLVERRKGSKVLHVAVATLGQLLGLRVTAASEQDRAQVTELATQVQAVTGHTVEVAFVGQGYTGDEPLEAAAKKGLVLLPRRWVVERSFAWTARFRRLARDYERLPQMLAGLHFLAFAILMLHRFIHLVAHCL
jgi:hypothetical protein